MSRDCTCIAYCRGSAGLGEGWKCVMESQKRAEPEQVKPLGVILRTWFRIRKAILKAKGEKS
jgi:hypothetical protein